MSVQYKIWIEIERIDTDENGEVEYSDCDCPEAIGYRDTFDDARDLVNNIVMNFGETD
jgi:hypothetical protein